MQECCNLHTNKLIFQVESFGENPSKVDFDTMQTSTVTFSSNGQHALLKIDVFIFERSRDIDRKKRPCIEPVSQQNKLESDPFSALVTCANVATVKE